ncbi:hypothetical protein [Pseudomonas maumuensis]|uniref:LTXXQ motif family protein n=1 Tax=Pseudomonas maumuensis TaxID=2842354 RepID=A0ABX8NPZ9_9PSED|nr:hypothetical protein [Pseudomonas maumuensis]QXH58105.1 hypothetical protein KSS90_07880 [Pseudomonas maumuensis]
MLITANGLGWQAVQQQQRNVLELPATQTPALQPLMASAKSSAQQNNQGSTSQQHAEDNRKEAFAKLVVMLQNPDVAKREQASVGKQEESSALQEFRDYMAKSPAEKIKEKMLQEMGLTAEEYDALPPEQKARIDEQIAQRLQEEVERTTQAKLEQQAQREQATTHPQSVLTETDDQDTERRYTAQL